MEKLIIAGAGPAGVSAALYATRLGITPLVIHNGAGALEKAVKIENYYGLPEVISGQHFSFLQPFRLQNLPLHQFVQMLPLPYHEYCTPDDSHAHHTTLRLPYSDIVH